MAKYVYYNKKQDTEVKYPRKKVNNKGNFFNSVLYSIQLLVAFINRLKFKLTTNLFAERNDNYKKITHSILLLVAFLTGVSGIAYRISNASQNLNQNLIGGSILGLDDVLLQGATKNASTNLTVSSLIGVKTTKYEVKEGDTLFEIADRYGVTADTIRWASLDAGLNPFTNDINVGMILTIPEINGVLRKVNPGDTIESILALVNLPIDEANFSNVVQLNGIEPPYTLEGRDVIFIPHGNLKQNPEENVDGIPKGVFTDPLAHPSCEGYNFSRGMTSYHNGIDLAKWDGCIITAVANGFVSYAGWSNYGEGYNVKIDHGGGIVTHYYHGNGEFYVKTGDRVLQGQPIMYMGSSGNSTGVHLHFSLFKNGIPVNPKGYVPYNGPW